MNSKTVLLSLFLGMTALSPAAFADSYAPFANYRAVDPTGRYYVVMKKIDRQGNAIVGVPVAFEIVERRQGSAPVAAVSDPDRYERASGGKATSEPVTVRKDDLVLGKGTLDRAPRMIVISSTGLGFVGVDVYGHNFGELRNGHAVVVVSKDGVVRHRKDLIDLFTESEVGGFFHTTGSVHWIGGVWIDERRKELVVVSMPSGLLFPRRLYRTVDMGTGRVRHASTDLILTALSERNLGALDDALHLTAELKLDRAKPDLAKILADRTIPLGSRLRSAVALAAMGDHQGKELIRKSAIEMSESRLYAIAHLPSVLGDDAAIVLCEVMRQGDETATESAALAMRHVSVRAGIPPLLALLHEGRSDCLDAAVECLEWKGAGAQAAVPDLIKLLATDPKTKKPLWTQQLAAMALGKIGPDSAPALPALISLAEKHAPEEWSRLKDQPPKFVNPFALRDRLADDYFIDAILRIRRK
jgi:hypothetical protein